jgi:hypothetical protein
LAQISTILSEKTLADQDILRNNEKGECHPEDDTPQPKMEKDDE